MSNINASTKVDAKIIIEKQGPRRWIFLQLYRLRMLGWVFFSILFFYLGVVYLVSVATLKPILIMNEAGQIVGQIDFVNDLQRTDRQYIHGGLHFLTCKLSRNSATIMNDVHCALNMIEVDSELYRAELIRVSEKPEYAELEEANLRSRIEFDKYENAPYISTPLDNDGVVWVRAKGTLIVIGSTEQRIKFDVTVGLVTIPRSVSNTYGIGVRYYDYN